MDEPEFKQFKEQLDHLDQEIMMGTVKSVLFVDGPKAGETLLMNWKDGKPCHLKMFMIVPRMFKLSEPVKKAEYEWNIDDEVFEFTGRTKVDFARDL